MIEYINSSQNKIIKFAVSLKNTKNMKENKMFLIESLHLILMAKDYLKYVITTKELDLDPSIIQYIVPSYIMDKLSAGKSSARCIGVCNFIDFNFKEDDTLIYLENIQDPGNLGTILRTALGFNLKNILISNNSCNIYNSKTIQSSEGAIFHLNIKYVDTKDIINLKNKGYYIVSTALSKKSIRLNELKRKDKTMLVFGNEGNGISKDILDISDKLVIIPIENIDSFNVGVSFGIVAYSYLSNSKNN